MPDILDFADDLAFVPFAIILPVHGGEVLLGIEACELLPPVVMALLCSGLQFPMLLQHIVGVAASLAADFLALVAHVHFAPEQQADGRAVHDGMVEIFIDEFA